MAGTLTQADLTAIQSASQSSGVPVSLLSAIALRESSGNPAIVNSTSGATGLFQVLPSTAADPGYGVAPLASSQLTDPTSNATFAAKYLAAQYQRTGSWDAAVRQFSGGGYGVADLGSGALAGTPTDLGAQAVLMGNAVAGDGTGMLGSGPATMASGNTTATTGAGGFINATWEYISRGGLILAGSILVFMALAAMLWQSKTVQVSAKALAA